MSYRRDLLVRWSTRDRLAVLVVGLTIAFLTGAVILSTAASAQVVELAGEFGTGGTVQYVEPTTTGSPPGAGVHVPTTLATTADSATPIHVVALPAAVTIQSPTGNRTFAPVDSGAVTGHPSGTTPLTVQGPEGSMRLRVEQGTPGPFPPDWYLTNTSTVSTLGSRGAFLLTPSTTGPAGTPAHGVPLRSVLAFFVISSQGLRTALQALALGGGILTAVTVYSVTRMTVRDRRRTIRIARSTGAPPRHVLGLFALRGGILTLVGTALGYALGVIIPNVAINLAVFVGLPTSLTASVSTQALTVLAPAYAVVLAIGISAGALASAAAVRCPPTELTTQQVVRQSPSESRSVWHQVRERFTPSLLGWRPLVPTVAVVTVFVALAVVLAAGAGAVSPLVAGDGQTITDPDAVHPIASHVPEAYGEAVDRAGSTASPEIIAFSVVDREAFLTRGVDFESYADLTGATLIRGRSPDGRNEAVVGASLADRLAIEPGDAVTLGGSTRAAVTRVDVVGIVDGDSITDNQLLVSLPTARHLTGMSNSSVQFIRTDGISSNRTGSSTRVLAVDAPAQVAAGESFTATAMVVNAGPERRVNLTGEIDDQTETTARTLHSFEQTRVRFTFTAPSPGRYRLTIANATAQVRTVAPGTLTLRGLPERAPPGSAPLVTVRTVDGEPVANATVTGGSRTVVTDADGRVRVPVGDPGTYTVVAQRGTRSVNAPLRSTTTATRTPQATLAVAPARPSVLATPTVRATLYNPWNRTLTRNVTLTAAGERRTRTVTLEPGTRTQLRMTVPRQPPGTFPTSVRSDDGLLAERTVNVSGDDRLAAALATSGHDQAPSGIGRLIATAFGNLQLLVATLVGLAGVMVVGSVTAAFASAVRARRRTLAILRATGATPSDIMRRVLGDALRIGVVATGLGLALGVAAARGLEAAGVLTLYGIRLQVTPSPGFLGALAGASLFLVVLGSGLAAWTVIRTNPATLLAAGNGAWSPDE